MIVLLFHYKFAELILNSLESGLKSRHSNQRTYYTYVKFAGETIENSCCDCPNGDREVGVCSHRATTIWFFWGGGGGINAIAMTFWDFNHPVPT